MYIENIDHDGKPIRDSDLGKHWIVASGMGDEINYNIGKSIYTIYDVLSFAWFLNSSFHNQNDCIEVVLILR